MGKVRANYNVLNIYEKQVSNYLNLSIRPNRPPYFLGPFLHSKDQLSMNINIIEGAFVLLLQFLNDITSSTYLKTVQYFELPLVQELFFEYILLPRSVEGITLELLYMRPSQLLKNPYLNLQRRLITHFLGKALVITKENKVGSRSYQ